MYKDVITGVIKRYGTKCTVTSKYGSGLSVYGFIQPLNYRNKASVGGIFQSDGYLDGGYYLFIGEPRFRADIMGYGTMIEANGQRYVVTRGEMYLHKGDYLYSRAVMRCVSEGDTDE